jgi:peptidoglycan hydrolase-like protein with peptidoglycan-binding domain
MEPVPTSQPQLVSEKKKPSKPTAKVADHLLLKLKKGEVLKVGSKGENVKRLQKFLEITGFYKGSVDGEFGWETKKALLSFQRVFELPTTGYVDQKCADFINELIMEAAYGDNKDAKGDPSDNQKL